MPTNKKVLQLQKEAKRVKIEIDFVTSTATVVLVIAAALIFRTEIIALNQAGAWDGSVITFGGYCVLAVAITRMVATLLPGDIKDALNRGWF